MAFKAFRQKMSPQSTAIASFEKSQTGIVFAVCTAIKVGNMNKYFVSLQCSVMQAAVLLDNHCLYSLSVMICDIMA